MVYTFITVLEESDFTAKERKTQPNEALGNPRPRQAWNLFVGCCRSPDSLTPTNRFLGCGLLKPLFYFAGGGGLEMAKSGVSHPFSNLHWSFTFV